MNFTTSKPTGFLIKELLLELKDLNEFQEKALHEIQNAFEQEDVTLLHGVTSSGKTEVYTKLIKQIIDKGKQVLFYFPKLH